MAQAPQKPRGDAGSSSAGFDAKIVRDLAKILLETGLTEIEVERGDLRVRVAKEAVREIAQTVVAAPIAAAAPVQTAAIEAPASRASLASHPGAVTSPMVGTVYLSPDPKADPFIKVGQSVSQGDTLLLIEAMKTFNPIPAPKSGKITEIVVSDSQPVEFGEVLVVID
jgi:acetyl-CoA carboxylase biotin carboxyl carrier protein